MSTIHSISVEGLFGLYDHSIELRHDAPVTIVAGPNGIGKTTLLRLASALLTGSYAGIRGDEFTSLEVTAVDGFRLRATPDGSDETRGRKRLLLQQFRPGHGTSDEDVVAVGMPDPRELGLPPYLEPFGDDSFIDTRDGERVPLDYVYARYARGRDILKASEPPSWFVKDRWRVGFIETKRLDTQIATRRSGHPDTGPRAPIYQYLETVADSLRSARQESARINQASTRTVARRLLTEYSRRSVKPDPLRARYARVGERASVLTRNGLLSDKSRGSFQMATSTPPKRDSSSCF